MIGKIHIQGLGPHVDTTLDLGDGLGVTEISAASESGKSTLMDAVCFVLWGEDRTGRKFPTDLIHDDSKHVTVTATLASGTLLRRRLTRDRKIERVVTPKNGRPTACKREGDFRAALGPLGEHREAIRHVMVPRAWERLYHGEGGGRPLRDLFRAILPKASMSDVVPGLVADRGHEFRDGDPIDEADAMERRREQRQHVSDQRFYVQKIETGLQAARARETTAARFSEEDLAEAKFTVALARRWDDYTAAADAHDEAWGQYSSALDYIEEWKARRAEISAEPPDGNHGPLEAARADLQVARLRLRQAEGRLLEEKAAHAAVERGLGEAKDRLKAAEFLPVEPDELSDGENALRRELADLMARREHADLCPTCSRDGWTEGAAKIEQALSATKAHLVDAVNKRRKWREGADLEIERRQREAQEEIDQLERLLLEAGENLATRERDVEEARDKVGQAEDMVQNEVEKNRARVKWDHLIAALGPAPQPPAEPKAAPQEPANPRPNHAMVADAMGLLEEATKAQGAAGQREQDADAMETELTRAQAALKSAIQEEARLDAILAAVREAPSVLVREQWEGLGDLGPLTMKLTDKGGVDLFVKDRRGKVIPIERASTGREVLADAWLRSALRYALDIWYLPLFVDQVQDVGGQPLPELEAPVVFMRTTENDEMVVATLEAEEAA